MTTIATTHATINAVWSQMASNGMTLEQFPQKAFWLSGAPGAGKGTNEHLIINYAMLYKKPLIASALLNTPEMLRKINQGLLLDDKTVISAVFEGLNNPLYKDGVLVDGFPRTPGQAESIAWLYEQLLAKKHKPLFAIFVLMIDEAESLRRQQHRAQAALKHNEEVKKTGKGSFEEVRPTDLDPQLASQRYEQFMKVTYAGLERLKDRLPFYHIDAQGSFKEVENRVLNALKDFFGK